MTCIHAGVSRNPIIGADNRPVLQSFATLLVVRKKDNHNKKTSHLILEMSMNEAFIWLSGHRIIDREIFNG